jgi:putative ABC transport system substrate-binding protein
MNKQFICLALCSTLFAVSFPAQAQQPKEVPRIGYLSAASLSPQARIEAFRQGLRELGYVEGKTSSLSGDLQRGNPNVFPRSRPS